MLREFCRDLRCKLGDDKEVYDGPGDGLTLTLTPTVAVFPPNGPSFTPPSEAQLYSPLRGPASLALALLLLSPLVLA